MKIGKCLAILSLTLALVGGSGCTTTNPTTGVREYDPVKTAKVCAVVQETVATATFIGIKKAPDSIPGFLIAEQVLNDLTSRGNATPQQVNAALLALNIRELKSDDAQLVMVTAVNTMLGLYNAAIADKARADVAADVYASNILGTLAAGISQGVTQAKQAGLIQ